MPDREKVIRGLECIAGKKRSCEGCPYSIPVTPDLGGFGYGYCAKGNVAKDALALLREQEPVVPESHFPDETCPACGAAFIGELSYYLGHTYKKYYAYCPGCGRKVKWDD